MELPLEARFATSDAAQYIKDQSNDDVAPEWVWTLSKQFLTGLQTAEIEKEVWESKNAKEIILKTLEASLIHEEVTAKNAIAYLKAVELLARNSTFSTNVSGSMLARNHDKLMNIADPEAKELYLSLLKDPDVLPKISNAYLDEQGKLDGDLIDIGHQFYVDIAKGFDMDDPEGCVKSWSLEPSKNLNKISALEKDNPGAAALLHNFYGIRDFHRWPTEFLKEQFETHGDTEKPYGLSIVADDRTLQLWREQSILRDVKPEYIVRALEVKSSTELVRRMQALDGLYGGKQKVSFATIHAHGSPESILFSTSETEMGSISLQNNFMGASKWFVENPLLVLASCSTGQEQGIAQKLSRQIHATVVGPQEDTGVDTIKVTKDNDSIRLIPSFQHSDDGNWGSRTAVEAVLYIDGERINPTDARYIDYFETDDPEAVK